MADFGITSSATKNEQRLPNFGLSHPQSVCDFGHNFDDNKSEYSCASMVTHSQFGSTSYFSTNLPQVHYKASPASVAVH